MNSNQSTFVVVLWNHSNLYVLLFFLMQGSNKKIHPNAYGSIPWRPLKFKRISIKLSLLNLFFTVNIIHCFYIYDVTLILLLFSNLSYLKSILITCMMLNMILTKLMSIINTHVYWVFIYHTLDILKRHGVNNYWKWLLDKLP